MERPSIPRYLRLGIATGLCLVLVGIVIAFALAPAIDAAADDRLREMDGTQRVDEALRLGEIVNWTVRVGVVIAIAGGLLAFSAWIALLVRPDRRPLNDP